MGRQRNEDTYRDSRGYLMHLDDREGEEEDREEKEEPAKEDEHFSQECRVYYERRERLKELERQRLRRSGEKDSKMENKPRPHDNYGSFFGPSEPIVARRIIEDARAREETSKVAARQAREISEHQRVSKGSLGMSYGVFQAKFTEKSRQSAVSNEKAEREQRIKEALDYSFLFSDEDPGASPPKNDAQTTKKESGHQPKQASPSVKGGAATQRLLNGVKPGLSGLAKPAMGAKMTKGSIPMASKGQERHSSKPPERPALSKNKVSSQSAGSHSNPSRMSSGPIQARPMQDISNGMKSESSTVAAQVKSLVVSALKQSVPTTGTAGKPALSDGVVEKKSAQLPGRVNQVSLSCPDQRRPSVGTVGQGAPTGHQDQKRPPQSAAMSKQVMRPSSRVPKRRHEFESDDDEGGGDISSMIRKLFGYNPNKYRDLDDEDNRFMETNFRSIQVEEKRSARIAREEDERELALIEEEQRRERERAKKKRKQLQ